MLSVVLVIQVIVTAFLIAIIMIQKSEGGGLGIGGSGGGMGDFLGAKGTASLLTKVTAVLAATFMVLSIILAILSSRVNDKDVSIVNKIVEQGVVETKADVIDAEIEKELTPEMQKIKDDVEKSIEEGRAKESPVDVTEK